MPTYVKRPLSVQAAQYKAGRPCRGVSICKQTLSPYVTTIHGQQTWIVENDWVIDEGDGVHFYPCRPDVFEKTYMSEAEQQSVQRLFEEREKQLAAAKAALSAIGGFLASSLP